MWKREVYMEYNDCYVDMSEKSINILSKYAE